MASPTPSVHADPAMPPMHAAMRKRRSRLLFVGVSEAVWQRILVVAERVGCQPQRVRGGDEALLMLAIEPALVTMIVVDPDRNGDTMHLKQWLPVVAPKARLMTMADAERL